MENQTFTNQELELLNMALRTRMNHERDDDKYIEFMILKNRIIKLISK